MSKEIERLQFLEYFQKGNKIVGVAYSSDVEGEYEVQLYDTATKSLKVINEGYCDLEAATLDAQRYFRGL